jgi:hypothetical protein
MRGERWPGFDPGGRHRQCDGHLSEDNGPPAVDPGRPLREGRARCAEAPVGHGRGRSRLGRGTAAWRSARVPGLSGSVGAVGLGPVADRPRARFVASAARPLRCVSGHPCVVAGHGVASAGRRGPGGLGRGVGSRGWSGLPADRAAVRGAGVNGPWLVAADDCSTGIGAVAFLGWRPGWPGLIWWCRQRGDRRGRTLWRRWARRPQRSGPGSVRPG